MLILNNKSILDVLCYFRKYILSIVLLLIGFKGQSQCNCTPISGFNAVVNGNTITSSSSGDVTNFPGIYTSCGVGSGPVWVGATTGGAYSHNYNFSIAVTSLTFVISASNPGENYTFLANNGITTSSQCAGSCPFTQTGNTFVVTSGWDTGTTIVVNSTLPFTSINISGNIPPATAGSLIGLCAESFFACSPPSINISSAPALCAGQSTTLSATGATNYTWTPNIFLNTNLGNTVISSPTSSTTYTVQGESGGCTGTNTVSIIVQNSPTINISSNTTVCSGQSATLTATGATNYTWTPNIFLNTNSGNSVISSPTTSTTYTVQGESGGCTGTNTVPVVVQSNLAVGVSSSPILCAGQSTTLSASGAANYTWTPNIFLNTNSGNTVVSSPTTSTTYTVQGESGGCTGTNTVSVVVQSNLAVGVSSSPTLCAGQSTTLSASGAANYTWTPNIFLNTNSGSSVISSPTISTTYTIQGDSSSGCTGSNTISVVVQNSPTINVSSSPTICAGQSATLSATGATNYTWTPNIFLNTNLGNTVTSTPTASITYTVFGGSFGCIGSNTVSVTLQNNPVITISSSPTICAGQSTTLSASGATSFTWSNGATTSTISVSPIATTIYAVVGISSGLCSSQNSSTVVVLSSPIIVQSFVSDVSCNGLNNGSIIVNSTGANTYSWSPSVSATNIASSLSAGVYTLSLFTNPSCSTIKTFTINQPNPLLATTTITNTVCDLCNGSASVNTIGGIGSYSYSWTPNISTQNIANNLCSGNYSLSIVDANNCKANYTISILPSIAFSASISASSYQIYEGESATILADAGIFYNWISSQDISCSTCSTIQVFPTNDQTYCVEVTSVLGCKDTVCVDIKINCGEVFVPNAFSPNNDGYNDDLKVFGNCIESLVFRIYNRWGELVFETTDKTSAWDGVYKGMMLNADVFVYQLNAELKSGESINKKGNITIVK